MSLNNIIVSHNTTRKHLIGFLKDVGDDQWQVFQENSFWSIQSTCVEILNYEIKLLNTKLENKIPLLNDNISKLMYIQNLNRVSKVLIEETRSEFSSIGFILQDNKAHNIPTYQWIALRSIQHSIYHLGGLSVLRHLVGLPRGDYQNWEQMVDSVFSIS